MHAATLDAGRQLEAIDQADEVERLLADLKQGPQRALGPAS
jgi:hypothetical protein